MIKSFGIGLFLFFTYNLFSQDKAPDFQFEDINQNISSLSDLDGNVLYVSFWASWCAPCIHNFNKYAPMRDSLEELGVILLNVNIDKAKDNWYEALDKHDINGLHVRGIELDTLQSQYELYSIPSYEIIDKKGMIVYLSDDVDRNIIAEFNNWLHE